MLKRLLLALPAVAAACGTDDAGYDSALLEQYRAALPNRTALTAPTPNSATRDVGDPALLPRASWELVGGINAAVGGMVDILEAVTAFPPTVYNSETQEFVWGPWELDGELGLVLVTIRELPEGSHFRYGYAFFRGVGNDVATYEPVIAGGATPNPDDSGQGVGITLWDFDANATFLSETFPEQYDAGTAPHGRFIALYGRRDDPQRPANEATWVLAYLRNYVSKELPSANPGDLDFFYGHYADNENSAVVDFVNFEGLFDLSEPSDGIEEVVEVSMAFLNGGAGRAEATASSEWLGELAYLEVVECWDTSIDRLYIEVAGQGAAAVIGYTEPAGGSEALCNEQFQDSLDNLDLPSLEDIAPELEAAMTDVANRGLSALIE